jgi:hypothetical protein
LNLFFCVDDSQDTPKAPATTGAFYFFNNTKHAQKRVQYLALFQGYG